MTMTTTKATFPKYPAYKDSGVEWLGEIPEHWETEKGKWLFIKNERPIRNEDDIVTCFRDGEVTLRKNRRIDGFTNALKEHGYQGIRKGDLVIHVMDAFAGAIGVSDSDGKSTPVYLVCTERFSNTVNQYYYAYFMRSMALNGVILSLAKGIRERSTDFRFNDFGELTLAFPPKEEQTAIAHFLDGKTAKIDRAIALKEKMIALLKERKQIIIQNAVTGKWSMVNGEWSMTPKDKMKDSGVAWIGEIPEHWEVMRMKYIMTKIQTGTTPPTAIESYFDGGINWYNPRDLNHEILINSEKTVSQKAIDRNEIKLFQKDSILIVGIGATTGKTAYMTESGTFNQQITGFHSNEQLNLYYFYLLKSLSIVMLNVASYTTLPILNNEFFKSFWLVIPPIPEQTAIVVHIETQSAKIEKAIALQEQQIEKLKELKSTLIDSAVTGKIKVI